MKNTNTVTIKNELPELLEALCSHPDCPAWLRNDIWDSFNNYDFRDTSYEAAHWRSILAAGVPMEDDREHGKCWTSGCENEETFYNNCLECWEKRIAVKRHGQWPEVVQ